MPIIRWKTFFFSVWTVLNRTDEPDGGICLFLEILIWSKAKIENIPHDKLTTTYFRGELCVCLNVAIILAFLYYACFRLFTFLVITVGWLFYRIAASFCIFIFCIMCWFLVYVRKKLILHKKFSSRINCDFLAKHLMKQHKTDHLITYRRRINCMNNSFYCNSGYIRLSQIMTKPTKSQGRPDKTRINLHYHAIWSAFAGTL